jgi:hypothetical protein
MAAPKLPVSKFMDPRDPERGESPPPTSVSPKPRKDSDEVAIKLPVGEEVYKQRDLQKVAARWLPVLGESKLSPGGRRRKGGKNTRKHTRKHRRATRRRA